MQLWTLECVYFFELMFSFSSEKYPEVELLDHILALSLIFEETPYSFTVAVPVYIYTNSIPEFLFSVSSPTFVIFCLFHNSHFSVWCLVFDDNSWWFWLMIYGSVGHCTSSLEKNVYSNLLPIFKLICLLLSCRKN